MTHCVPVCWHTSRNRRPGSLAEFLIYIPRCLITRDPPFRRQIIALIRASISAYARSENPAFPPKLLRKGGGGNANEHAPPTTSKFQTGREKDSETFEFLRGTKVKIPRGGGGVDPASRKENEKEKKKDAGVKRANDRRARPRDDGHVCDVILTSVDRWRAPHAPSDTQRKIVNVPLFSIDAQSDLQGNSEHREKLPD